MVSTETDHTRINNSEYICERIDCNGRYVRLRSESDLPFFQLLSISGPLEATQLGGKWGWSMLN